MIINATKKEAQIGDFNYKWLDLWKDEDHVTLVVNTVHTAEIIGDGYVIPAQTRIIPVDWDSDSSPDYAAGSPYLLSYRSDRKKSISIVCDNPNFAKKIANELPKNWGLTALVIESRDLFVEANSPDNRRIISRIIPKGDILIFAVGKSAVKRNRDRSSWVNRMENILDRWASSNKSPTIWVTPIRCGSAFATDIQFLVGGRNWLTVLNAFNLSNKEIVDNIVFLLENYE